MKRKDSQKLDFGAITAPDLFFCVQRPEIKSMLKHKTVKGPDTSSRW